MRCRISCQLSLGAKVRDPSHPPPGEIVQHGLIVDRIKLAADGTHPEKGHPPSA
jgi:hypothetical protein